MALAEQKGLASSREWNVLLHYKPHGPGRESLVDDPGFFIAPDGKINPVAELTGTLAGMFAPPELADSHPQCRFPARFSWLVKELHIEADQLPHPTCGQLDKTLKSIDPRSAVLVFPAAHTNGPASMFGHTLIKIGSSYKNELLSHAVNYAAHSIDSNGLLYAFKGIFGLYPGYYSILPYYEKLKEYGDLEHRDVWEYQLNLSPEEVRRMVLHIWELQEIKSDYFFFDENCSFNLLFLLEAARPQLSLAEEYWLRSSFWVIPIDTVSTVRRAGLIEQTTYRPSQATRILYRASLLDDFDQNSAVNITLQHIKPDDLQLKELPIEEKRQVLDLAAEYLQYRYSRREVTPETFQGQFLPILKSRSELGPGEHDSGRVPSPAQPEDGHLPAKISMGGGVRNDSPFFQLSWQPAYHDLMDAEDGYTRGAQVNFMSVSGRYYSETEKFMLQRLRPVDIVSLAPRDRFFQPVSWKVNFGADSKILRDGTDRTIFRLNTGGGVAWNLPPLGMAYGMAEADLNISDRFDNNAALGGGGSIGLLHQGGSSWTAHLHARAFTYLIDNHTEYLAALDQQFALSRRAAIGIKTKWEQSFDHNRAEAMLEVIGYY
ncbi:MAG: DUF4105 domain-containing protein [Desulfuromonadaceae bacterium]|nr:DUF4105 domain-containing protein [Desulfuromonadaceae bacterium]MDD5106348.1 DUF4105 domain-containing protein [Desulfuromonadaceae bacterium]